MWTHQSVLYRLVINHVIGVLIWVASQPVSSWGQSLPKDHHLTISFGCQPLSSSALTRTTLTSWPLDPFQDYWHLLWALESPKNTKNYRQRILKRKDRKPPKKKSTGYTAKLWVLRANISVEYILTLSLNCFGERKSSPYYKHGM